MNASDPSGRDFVHWIYETGMAVVAAKVTRVLVCRFVVGYVVYEIMHELRSHLTMLLELELELRLGVPAHTFLKSNK